MKKQEQKYEIVKPLLFKLYVAGDALSVFFMTPYQWRQKALYGSYDNYRQNLYHLIRRGVIRVVKSEGERFLQLTEQGKLKVLMEKSFLRTEGKWDGKWRMVIFDIPKGADRERDKLRFLLKKYGYKKAQASVYVSPWSLNREAVEYLKVTGLNKYIRFLKVEEMDDDTDLKKLFKL